MATADWGGEDGAYAALIAGKTCLDCGKCVPSERAGFEGIGWCREAGCHVYMEDGTVADQGLECFA